MASAEDREHAEGLRHDYQRRLRVRERQKARMGDAADPSVDVEIEQLRFDIAALNELLDAAPSEAVQAAASRLMADNNRFLFVQAVKTNQRLAKVEERTERMDVTQHAAAEWRLAMGPRIERIEEVQRQGELSRRLWSPVFRAAWVAAVLIAVMALYFALR